ncbi:putative membrane protein ycf78 [Rhizoctonia solani]|uniref:Putative membrane protein ycf78 n=1 Tax=Rhizoctonia solani TaxID=456999 RepID=A0A0K6GIY3_9AGAM|nr:putative membrane protein ycf78 [Rhizoctonia solani]
MVDTTNSDSDSSMTPTEQNTMNHYRSPEPPPHETSSRPAALHETKMPAPEVTRQHQTRDNTVRILVVGRSGSGKTRLIQTLCDERASVRTLFKTTTKPYSTFVRMRECEFELIDTPGFDNMSMSDAEAFIQIADYLLEPRRIEAGVNGVIFVHRVGDSIQSRSLRQNLQVSTDIFLKEAGTSRLTVLESQLGIRRVAPTTLLDEVRYQHSAFDSAGKLGATVSQISDRLGFIDLLKLYASQTPIMLPIQLEGSRGSRSDFTTRIERTLGYYGQGSVQTLLRSQEHNLRETYEPILDRQRESESQLQQRLKEAELGYSSLRSQLQLQENVEQSEVVQALNDLNRMIDDIGRSTSAYLTDTYVSSVFGRDPSNVTALDSIDLPALKTLLDHVDGEASLIMSSRGKGMQIECFLDFAIRHMICRHLTREIFEPFHPAIIGLNRVLTTTFRNIQSQAPQVLAGKWRSETFKNIYHDDPDERRRHVDARIHKLMDDRLKPLIMHVFGKGVPFTEDHSNSLHRLFEVAWDWNSQLKGDIIMLGDFTPTSYRPRFEFSSTLMEEFEHNPRHLKRAYILGTLALGLVIRRAVGGGNPVERNIVCKATVLTSNAFI